MFHESRRLLMLLDDPAHGWTTDGKVKWSDNYFPDDITELLISCENCDDNTGQIDEDYTQFDDGDGDFTDDESEHSDDD